MPKSIRTSIERYLHSPAYFILFSVYPVLWFYANNVYSVLWVGLIRSLFISLLVALLFFWIFQRVTRHSQTAALMVFVIFLAFFYYGHVRNLLITHQVVIQDGALAGIWLMLIVLISMLIGRFGRCWNDEIIAVTMNLITIILILFPVILLLVYTVMRAIPLERKMDDTIHVDVNSASPDIYYIILDAYTRSDVMKNSVGYDNSLFINSLKDMGFYVAECSQSNYGMTSLSVSSTLNMDYLQNISDAYRPERNSLLPAFKALDSNVVRNTLTEAGYETVAFASGFTWIEWRDAEHFLSPGGNRVTEFEAMILFSSYARILDDFGIVNIDDVHAENFRTRTRFDLDSFDELVNLPSPKFVFLHIIAPHPPFGLDENGDNIAPDEIDSLTGYTNQVKFISTAVLPKLQKLITESDVPPVIIIQGDHGRLESDPADLMTILNAYYMPGHTDQLYPSISPVNSFRVVLNSYFGTNLPLLEDISYFSPLSSNYDFSVVPNTCQ